MLWVIGHNEPEIGPDSLEMICDEFNVDFQFEDEYGVDILDKERNYMLTEYEPVLQLLPLWVM